MPIYEYRCGACDRIREVTVLKVGDAPEKENCVCGGTMRRIISQSSFILKGSGWAKDGYK